MGWHRVKLIRHSVFVFAVIALAISCACSAATAELFPPNGIRVFSNEATSGILHLRFENIDIAPSEVGKADSCTYLVAGAPGRIPSIRLTAARYLKFRSGRVVGEVLGAPPQGENAAGEQTVLKTFDLGRFRQYHVYAVTAMTTLHGANARSEEQWVADYVEADIDLGPPPATPPDASEWNVGLPARQQLLNANIDPGYYETTPTATTETDRWAEARHWATMVNEALKSGPVWKLHVYSPGTYMLPIASFGEGSPDINNWRLFHDGKPVPLFSNDATAPLFVVANFDQVGEGEQVYWLFSSAASLKPCRGEVRQPAGPDSTTTTLATLQIQTGELADYHARLRPTPDATRWYWKAIADRAIGGGSVNLPKDFAPVTSASLEMDVTYGFPNPPGAYPMIELIVNGHSCGSIQASSIQGRITFHPDAAFFHPGANSVGLRPAYPTAGAGQPELLLQKITTHWTQPLLDAEETTDIFQLVSPTTGTIVEFSQPLAKGSAPLLFEVTESPVAHADKSLTHAAFGPVTQPKAPLQIVLPGAAQRVPRVERAAPMTFFDHREPADYLAIAHPSLMDALKPLLNYRSDKGHKVTAIDVDTVYDHFAFGQHTPAAIKSLLGYAMHNWPAPKLQYVLLVGESSDYRGDPALVPAQTTADMVPVNASPLSEGPHGDHTYSTVIGPDSLSDLGIGRLSVRSAAELTSVVAKIIRYEQTPPGDWIMNALFVEDDNEEFPKVVADVISKGVAPWTAVKRFREADYTYVPNMRVPGRKRSWDATERIIAELNQGSAVVNFFGHGGPNLWTHERLLHLLDMPRLTNAPRLPFITCASCDNAWLDYPLPPVNASMGEIFVKKGNGGAIGLFGPVSGASPYEHATLVTRLMEGFYRKQTRRIGDATWYARNMYIAETNSTGVPEQYILLGDPACELTLPRLDSELELDHKYVPSATSGSHMAYAVNVTLPTATPIKAAKGVNAHSDLTTGILAVRSAMDAHEISSQTVALSTEPRKMEAALSGLAPGRYGMSLWFRDATGEHVAATRLNAFDQTVGIDEAIPDLEAITSGPVAAKFFLRLLNCINVAQHPAVQLSSEKKGWQLSIPSMDVHERGSADLPILDTPAPDDISVRYTHSDTDYSGIRSTDSAWRYADATTVSLLREATTNSEALAFSGRIATIPATLSAQDNATLRLDLWNTTGPITGKVIVSVSEKGVDVAEPTNLTSLLTGRNLITVTLREAPAAGTHRILARASWVDARSSSTLATTASIATTSREYDVVVVPGADLTFEPGSAHADVKPGTNFVGSTVFVRAILRNKGGVSARNAQLQLYTGGPDNQREGMTVNDTSWVTIDEVKPGESIPVVFRWENADAVGSQRVSLSVNKQRGIKESDYANNTIEVPSFELKPPGNFKTMSLDVKPDVARSGSPLKFHMVFSYDGVTTRGPVDIEYGLRNLLTGESDSQRTVIPQFGPGQTVTFDEIVTAVLGMTHAFATVDASRDIEEVDPGDDTIEQPLQVVESIPACEQAKDISLIPTFADSETANMDLMPGGGLRLSDTFSSGTGLIPISQSMTTTTPVGWTVLPWLLESSAAGVSESITLKVPGAVRGVMHDVYVYTKAPQAYKGGHTGNFTVAIEGQPPRSYDAQATGDNKWRRNYLGRFDLGDENLDITVTPSTGTIAVLQSFELRPAAGFVTSPVLETTTGTLCRLQLGFDENTTSTDTITYEARSGRISDGNVLWDRWQPVSGKNLPLPEAPLLQWKAVVRPVQGVLPVISDARLRRQ